MLQLDTRSVVTDEERLVGSANYIPGRVKGGAIRPSVRLWPNGEYTLGYAPGGDREVEMEWARWVKEVTAPLDLAMLSNSHNPLAPVGKKRGQSGLTSRGARLVRNASDAIQRFVGAERMSFATMTLPVMAFEEYWEVSSQWSEIVRRFFQRLTRHLRRKGSSEAYCSVTELQPKRTNREGVPALHLHFVFVGRKKRGSEWLVGYSDLRTWWKSELERVVGRELDCSHTENVQEVKNSASGYLSKYMSKGGDLVAPMLDNEMGWSLPTAWYNISLKLKRWVVENTNTSEAMAELVEVAWRSGLLPGASDYFYEGVIEECSGPGPHFCIGRLKPPDYEDLVELYRAQQVAPLYEVC